MTNSQALFLDRGTGRIAYDVTGDATAPLVVCIPGMGDLRSTFRHLVPALVDEGYRVATLDLRGHGDSDTTFDAFDDVAAATDALALVEHLGAGDAVLVGNSMGAGAAVWAAAERPDLVAGLALLGPFVRDPDAGTAKASLMKALFAVVLARPWGPLAWRAYYATLTPTTKDDDFAQHRDAVMTSLRRPGRWAAFRRTTKTTHEPAHARMAAVRVPTLVVMGTKDPDFTDPAAEAQYLSDGLRDSAGDPARVVLVDGAGHYPQSEFPAITTPAVVDLVARVHARA